MNIIEKLRQIMMGPGPEMDRVTPRSKEQLKASQNQRYQRPGNKALPEELFNMVYPQQDVRNSWPQSDWDFSANVDEMGMDRQPYGSMYYTGEEPVRFLPDMGFERELRIPPYMPQKYPAGFDFSEVFKKRIGR